ncbi:MAG: sulfotransferase [Acidimicrobiales bacterium]
MGARILVAGPPRSGTTWVAELLAAGEPVWSVHEPDNHRLWPSAVVAKAGRGRQPVIADGDGALQYRALWVAASQGADNRAKPGIYARKAALKAVGTRVVDRLVIGNGALRHEAALHVLAAAPKAKPRSDSRPVVVKTVHANFSLEFVAEHFDRVVLVRRDPRNAVASWLGLGWSVPRYEGDPGVMERVVEPAGLVPPARHEPTVDTAWAYALLDHQVEAMSRAHPEWLTVHHEQLCDDPLAELERLYHHAGLTWNAKVGAAVVATDREGAGYATRRKRSEQRDRWKKRLTDDQVKLIEQTLDSTGVR